MASCPRGHDSSTGDYCDVCGTPIAPVRPSAATPADAAMPAEAAMPAAVGQPPAEARAPAALAPAGPPAECPLCGSPQTGRFCERDGYDFLAASLNPSGAATPPDRPQPASAGWLVEVGADQLYFEKVKAAGGPDAGALQFPRFLPRRRFPLGDSQVLIGRHSRSRGINPDIDLAGPPEDPGVSHSHALLVDQPGGGWAVVDLGSSNGTYVNDTANAIDVNVPVPVGDGDRIYLGAWTVITVHAG